MIKAITIHGYHGNVVTVSPQIKSYGEFLFQQQLYRNQSIDWQCKAIEWVLYKHAPTEKKFLKRL